MIVSIASTTRDAGLSAMSLGQEIELLHVFRKQANNIMMDFNWRANLGPCCLHFLFILQHRQARRGPQRHSIMSRTWCNGLSLSAHHAIILDYYFFTSAASRSNLFLITGIIVMISGIAFDHLSRLRTFPYDRFKVYRIVTIVRIELNSIQAIEVVSVVRLAFPYDRLNIKYLRRLRQSCGNQALLDSNGGSTKHFIIQDLLILATDVRNSPWLWMAATMYRNVYLFPCVNTYPPE